MELWSNDILTEFAIKLNSIVVVMTSNNLDAMGKIDVCPYRPGYEFDWHYTLSQWVVCYLANKYHSVTGLQNIYTKRVRYSR